MSFILLTFLFLMLCCVNCSQENSISIDRSVLEKSLQNILLLESQKYGNSINLYVYHNESSMLYINKKYHYEDLLKVLLMNLGLSITYNIHFQTEVYFRSYPHFNMLLVDTFGSLRSLYRKLLAIGTSNLGHTIIYVAELQDQHFKGFEQFFGVLYKMSILNVGIVVRMPTAEIVMVTYYPFDAAGCHVTNPVIFNRYDSLRQRWHSDVFFPSKVSNFNGCTLTCATFESMPFMRVKRDVAGQAIAYVGLEGEFLELLQDKLNISTGLYMMSAREVQEANNATGLIFRDIFQQAEYAIGSFFYRSGHDPFLRPFSQTATYSMSTVYIVTNVISEHYMYEQLILPFDGFIWTITALCILIGCLVIFITGAHYTARHFVAGHHNRLPYFNLYSVLMGVSVVESFLPRRNFARALLMIWILGTLVLRSAYQSAMFQIFLNDLQYHPPQTVADVLAQQYFIETTEEYYRLLEPLPELHSQVHVHNLSSIAAFETILHHPNRRRAIIAGHEYFGYFRKQNRVAAASLHLVPEPIFTQQMSIYVRPNSFLVPVLNEQIANAITYGYNRKWRRMFGSDVSEQHNELAAEHEDDNHAVVLKLRHLQGAFMIVLWMLLFSMGILGMEMIVGRRNWQRFQVIFSS